MAYFHRLTRGFQSRQANRHVPADEAFHALLKENDELRQTAVNIALENAALRERLRNTADSAAQRRGQGKYCPAVG
jgi:hypothetical protein